MPRSKSFYPAELAILKQNAEDIIFDFILIADNLLKQYSEYLYPYEVEELNKIKKRCKKLYRNQLQYKNRIYITSDLNFVSLMMVDTDEAVKENLLYACDTATDNYESDVERIYNPCIWVFESTHLVKSKFVTSKIGMELCSVFYKENLVNYGSGFRDFWYSKPRKNFR